MFENDLIQELWAAVGHFEGLGFCNWNLTVKFMLWTKKSDSN